MTPPECPLCDRELGIDEEDHIYDCHRAKIQADVLAEREAIAEFVRTHKVIWSSEAPHIRVEQEETDKAMETLAAAIRGRPAP